MKINKSEWKIPFGKTSCRWKDNNEIYFKDIMYEYMDWIPLAQVGDQWRNFAIKDMNDFVI
jgi:hypothetical protein